MAPEGGVINVYGSDLFSLFVSNAIIVSSLITNVESFSMCSVGVAVWGHATLSIEHQVSGRSKGSKFAINLYQSL